MRCIEIEGGKRRRRRKESFTWIEIGNWNAVVLAFFFVDDEKVSGIISERDYVCKIALLGKASKDTTVSLRSILRFLFGATVSGRIPSAELSFV